MYETWMLRESRSFDISDAKGLKAAERYQSKLYNRFDRVTVTSLGLNRVRIEGSDLCTTKNH